jgi:GTPase
MVSYGGVPGFAQVHDAVEFIIDETFQVAGVGVVVAGTVKRGTLVQGASLLLGPHAGDASFKPTAIKSIAYKRLPVTKVSQALHVLFLICGYACRPFAAASVEDGCWMIGGGWTDGCTCTEEGQAVLPAKGVDSSGLVVLVTL